MPDPPQTDPPMGPGRVGQGTASRHTHLRTLLWEGHMRTCDAPEDRDGNQGTELGGKPNMYTMCRCYPLEICTFKSKMF